jgi:O-antigen ligase
MRRSSFTWWQAAWLVLFLSGLSFRARTAAEISDSPVDAWALYRIACVGIVALILFVRLTLRRTNWLPFLFSGVIGLFALYPLFSLVSMVWSVNPPWTIYKSVEFLIDLSMVAAVTATVQSAGEYRRLVNWSWTLLGLLIVTAWIGAVVDPSDALFGGPGLQRLAALPMRLLGLVPSVSCNDLSEVAAVLALVALCRIFFDEDSQPRKARYWCLFGAASVTLVMTQTRGSFLAFLVGLVSLLILTRRYTLVMVGGVTSCVIAVPLLFFTRLGATVQDFLLRGETVEGASGMSGRLEMWQTALDKIAQRPWSGYGGFAGGKFVIVSRNSVGSDTLSSYFDSLLNLGVFGLAILLVVLVLVGTLLYRSIRDPRLLESENYLALEMFVVFTVVLIRSFESSNLITHPMLAFLTILGVAEFLRRRRQLAKPPFFTNASVTV